MVRVAHMQVVNQISIQVSSRLYLLGRIYDFSHRFMEIGGLKVLMLKWVMHLTQKKEEKKKVNASILVGSFKRLLDY